MYRHFLSVINVYSWKRLMYIFGSWGPDSLCKINFVKQTVCFYLIVQQSQLDDCLQHCCDTRTCVDATRTVLRTRPDSLMLCGRTFSVRESCTMKLISDLLPTALQHDKVPVRPQSQTMQPPFCIPHLILDIMQIYVVKFDVWDPNILFHSTQHLIS